MAESFYRRLVIDGKAKSTHENYLRQISKLALYHNKSPLTITEIDLEEYLYYLIENDTASQSSFKHLIFGLRKLYSLFEKDELLVKLPKLSGSKKLPVVLSKQEVKRLLFSTTHLKERVLFGLIYDTGMRISEVLSLLIRNVDLERRQIHICLGKGKKDRYVTLSSHAIRGLKKYLTLHQPKDYVFENAARKGIPLGPTTIRKRLKEMVEKAGIQKVVCVHTLRHTYATHQLESGQNIVDLQLVCSCRNRNCPKCGAIDKEKWLIKREQDILDVRYFHVVFTVPDKLNNLFLANKVEMYNLLFTTVNEVIKDFGQTDKWIGGRIGMTAILHT